MEVEGNPAEGGCFASLPYSDTLYTLHIGNLLYIPYCDILYTLHIPYSIYPTVILYMLYIYLTLFISFLFNDSLVLCYKKFVENSTELLVS